MTRVVLAAWIAALAACGSDGAVTTDAAPPPSDGGDMPDASVTLMDAEERASASIAAFGHMQVLESLGLPRQLVAAQMVAYFLSSPAFQSAGYSPELDNVWANFQDGVPFLIFDNHDPEPFVVPEPAARGTVYKADADTVPKDRQYRILRSLGDAFSANEAATRTLLNRSGYTAAALMSDHIDHLLTDVTGDGFFMWATHGGQYAYARDGTTLMFGLSTRTDAPAASERQEPYKTLLASEEIGIGFAGERYATDAERASANAMGIIDANTAIDLQTNLLNRRVYFINPKFIRTRFKFGENSVVIVNACTSYDLSIRSAFDDAGAAAYLGWDKPTSKGGPISFLAIDRMIGGSAAPPPPSPRQRPFDITQVFEWMEAGGLNSYVSPTYGRVTFTYKLLGETYGILAPSIRSIQILESSLRGTKARIEVSGIFGTKDDAKFPRRLLVNGVPQTITGGDRDTIEGEIDSTGPGSFGECVVEVGQRTSNIAPITAWTIPVVVEATTAGSAKYTVTINVAVRADVHLFRAMPGGPADGADPDVPLHALLMEESRASWTSGGSFSDGTCTHTLSGSGTARLPSSSGELPYLFGAGSINRRGLTIAFDAFVLAGAMIDDHIVCPLGPAETRVPVAVPPTMTFRLDPETFEVEPGEATFNAEPFRIKATWEGALPFFPPDRITPS